MIMHKLIHKCFTACGKALKFTGGRATNNWDFVECKRCLTHRKKKQGAK